MENIHVFLYNLNEKRCYICLLTALIRSSCKQKMGCSLFSQGALNNRIADA